MTLPFRRRHHDDEASHDRARALVSDGFAGPLAEGDATWLEDHLGRCPECRAEREGYLADRALVRGLRDRLPEPPRDLWARTAAAIEAEARPARGPLAGLGQLLPAAGPRRIPLGVIAGALVVLVVVGTALLPRARVPILPPPSSGPSQVAVASAPGATPWVPEANRVAWVQRSADGSFSLVFANVDHACPAGDPTCAPLADSSPAPLTLAAPPQAVVLSPGNDQIAVVGSNAETAGSVLIVDVPTPRPSASAGASPLRTAQAGTPVPTTPSPTTPLGSTSPAPAGGARAIISGVIVVGAIGYSTDGDWLAFSARPKDGPASRGPDLYLWRVGDLQARQVTSNGETFFSGWYGDLVVASGIVPPPSEEGSPAPAMSAEPSAEATGVPAGSGPPASPGSSPASSPISGPIEAHPYSFLLDPTTGARSVFALPDVWLPSIDPTGRFVTYWSGTVTPAGGTAAGAPAFGQVEAWRPATGRLVLDGWTSALAPQPSSSPGPTESTSGEPPSGAPASPPPTVAPAGTAPAPAGPSSSPGIGPVGTPIELALGPIADFDAQFDPTGRRLAIWVLDAPDSSAGRLWLVVLDPVAGAVDARHQPMAAPGVQALRGFTIDRGRLAWATPAGQDGQPSSVQVLAWKGDDFGEVQSVPGGNPQVVR